MNCESCGMPMEKPEDHGGGDPSNTWCKHCCHRRDGSHKSREEVKKGMTTFMLTKAGKEIMSKMNQKPCSTREEAEKAAEQYMSMMPAWK